MTWEMNSEVFSTTSTNSGVLPGYANNVAEIEVFNQPDTKMLIMNTILHSADVSNPCRTWIVTKAWAHACLEEFFAQGDQEKVLGIPVMYLNDRDKLNRPNSQIGFIEFMIAPFFAAQVRIWPTLSELADNLSANIQTWQELWAQEVNPSEDDASRVIARITKVQDLMQDAKHRGTPPNGAQRKVP